MDQRTAPTIVMCNVEEPYSKELPEYILFHQPWLTKKSFSFSYLLPTNLVNTENFIKDCARKNDKIFDNNNYL